MGTLRLEDLSAANIMAANTLTLKPGQEDFIAPVSFAVLDESVDALAIWSQVVLDGDEVVAFIRGNFDPEATEEELRSCLVKLQVAAAHQGEGVGTFAIEAIAAEAKKRGFDHLHTIWGDGEDGPEQFFVHVGFAKIGQTRYGENIGRMSL